MDILFEIAGTLALVIAFWLKTGRLEARIADVARAIEAKGGTLTGDAISDRFEALEHRLGRLGQSQEEAIRDSDTAKRSVQSLRTQLTRDEEKLKESISAHILPTIVAQLSAMASQGIPNGAPKEPDFLVR